MHSLTQTRIAFTKMHGAGNDFVILDARRDTPAFTAAQIARLSDRRRGIGCDQLILLETPQNPDADIAMRIHNQDATIAGACGNATRCVAALLAEQTGRTQFTIETAAGLLQADILPNAEICIDMGPAHLAWSEIPLATQCDTLHTPIPGDPACVSIGNPHATLFVPDLAAINPATLGPDLEQHPIFPERANIGFAQILAPDRIRLRVWERGAGLTLACGSGACAALVNAHRRGLTGRTARLDLDGGTLHIEWRATDGHVLMTGPAATAFRGIFDFADLHA